MGEEEHPSMVEAAIERLNQDPLLLAVITTIPYFGGSITQLITGFGQAIVQERNKRLFEQLTKHLETLDEQAIKKDYFETDEGIDLFIKAVDESRRTRSDEKRDLIARILAGAASIESETGHYSPEEYLNTVAALTVKELTVARTIYRLQNGINHKELEPNNEWKTWLLCREQIIEEHDIDENDLSLILDRIASTGLTELIYIMFPGSPGRTYWSTPTFDKLMRFLQLEA